MTAPQPPWAIAYGPGVPLHLDYDDSTLVDRGGELMATTKTSDRTGGQMEALTAGAAAGLAG